MLGPLIALASLFSGESGTARQTVLVMPVAAMAGASADLAQVLTAALVTQSARLPGFSVTSYHEVQGAMTNEQLKQVAGCDSVSCAAEIAGSLNVDQIVIGSLGQVGQEHVLQLSRIQARDAQILGRVMLRTPLQDETSLLDRMGGVVDELFVAPTAAPVPTETSESAGPRTLLLRALGAGGLLGGGLGVLLAAAGVGVVPLIYVAYGTIPGLRHYEMPLKGTQVAGAGVGLVSVLFSAAAVLLGVGALGVSFLLG